MAGKDALNYSLNLECVFKSVTGSDSVIRGNLETNFNDELFLILNFLKSSSYFNSTEFNYWYEMYKLPDGMKLSEALEDNTLKESLEELIAWIKTLKK